MVGAWRMMTAVRAEETMKMMTMKEMKMKRKRRRKGVLQVPWPPPIAGR